MHNRYYLMRHGESLANRSNTIVSAPENALNSYGLTALGAEQVMQTALQTRLNRDTLIISSDYRRARETAEIVSNVIGLKRPIEFDQRLRERCFGIWELKDHNNYQGVWQNDLTQPQKKIDGVETIQSVLNRTLELINDLEQQYRHETVLLVGHGDVLQILLAHHHSINPRFHRSLSSIGNADIRSLMHIESTAQNIA